MKAIITVVGRDEIGIISKVCNYLAHNSINVLDINQSIMDEFFNMFMIVDLASCESDFSQIAQELNALGVSINVKITIQMESIFKSMHRL